MLVWNGAPTCEKEVRSLAEEFPIVSVIEAGRLTGASESRFELANRVKTEFVFFSDDDIYADPGALPELECVARHLPCDPAQVCQRYLSEFEYRFNRRFDLLRGFHVSVADVGDQMHLCHPLLSFEGDPALLKPERT